MKKIFKIAINPNYIPNRWDLFKMHIWNCILPPHLRLDYSESDDEPKKLYITEDVNHEKKV